MKILFYQVRVQRDLTVPPTVGGRELVPATVFGSFTMLGRDSAAKSLGEQIHVLRTV